MQAGVTIPRLVGIVSFASFRPSSETKINWCYNNFPHTLCSVREAFICNLILYINKIPQMQSHTGYRNAQMHAHQWQTHFRHFFLYGIAWMLFPSFRLRNLYFFLNYPSFQRLADIKAGSQTVLKKDSAIILLCCLVYWVSRHWLIHVRFFDIPEMRKSHGEKRAVPHVCHPVSQPEEWLPGALCHPLVCESLTGGLARDPAHHRSDYEERH